MLEAKGLDRTRQHARALGRPQPLRGEERSPRFIRLALGFERQDLRRHLREPTQVTQGAHGTGDFPLTDGPTPPYDARPDGITRQAMQDHVVNEAPQQRLPLSPAQRVLVPHRRQGRAQRGEGRAPPPWDRQGDQLGSLLEAMMVFLRLVQGLQGRFPAPFEFVRHQPILRLYPLVTPPGHLGLIPQTLLGQLMRPLHGVLLRPALVHGLLIEVECHGREGREAGSDDVVIDRISGQTLTHRRLGLRPAVITQLRRAPCVWHDQLVPTDTAGDQALPESRALARHAAPAVVLIGGVMSLQDGLNPLKGLPGKVGRVAVGHHHLPCGGGQPALPRAGAAWLWLWARFPIHKHASVGGMAQDGNDRSDSRRAPAGLAVPVTAGPPQALLPQEADHVADRLLRQEQLEHQGQDVRHRQVRIFDHAAILLTEQAHGQGQGQVAPLRLLLYARQQPATQGMELHFTQHPLHPTEETAVGGEGS